jgi:hypothetical protein
MGLIRAFIDILHDQKMRLYPVFVKSECNLLADLASRGKFNELDLLIPQWRNSVNMHEIYARPRHLTPGYLSLFGKGYIDGSTSDQCWNKNNINIVTS